VAGLNGTNNNVEPAYLAPNVISGLITRGPGLVPSTATNSITSTSWTLPVISSVADAIASNDYYSVTLTAGSGYHLAITSMALRVQRSSTGPSNYTLRASTDTFGSDLTTWNIGGSTTAQNIQTPLAIGSTNNVEFRIYGHRAGAGSGTGRIQDGADFGQAGIDLGIFGSTIPVSVMEPEIGVLGTNGLLILDGDATPDVADGTDFGSADVATGLVTRTFGITNSGTATLTISGVTTGGTHASDFSIITFPASVDAGTRSNLVIQFNPATNGLRTATIIVNNTDADESVFDFAVQGTGTSAPPSTPTNMALIPSGGFVMGNATNVFPASEGFNSELPQHMVNVSAFYMDIYEVTKAVWDEVKAYNGGNGYSYSNTGLGKATNHPVQTVNWFDVVKWCNARSERDGLTPVYYSDAGFTTLYKTNEIAPFANWAANGYRLPTEAEWEKAARGGAANTRFPWMDYTNNITWAKANYYGRSNTYSYDLDGGSGAYHPNFTNVPPPNTSPVGYFAPNGYGLYDMAGNVLEWCWDWYDGNYYASSPASDPRGPTGPLSSRVIRGGCWNFEANYARVACRLAPNPDEETHFIGFRCARGLDMPAPENTIPPWINEVNYDPPGTDANEYVEVAGLTGEDLTNYRLVLYNGGNSLVYNTFTLSGTIDDEGCGYGAVSFDTESIQNGAPDGVALAKVVAGVTSLVHFLSYEGSMTAVGGPADGVTASSIGTQTDDANTLQLQGSGTNYADYTWALNTSSKGTLNAGQSIPGCTPVIPTNIAFVSAGASVSENDGAVTVVVFKTSSSGAVSAQISLSGTATQGVDYTISTTNINLSGATTSQTIVITLINDAVVESEEIVVMTLMNVVGGNLVSPGAYSLTITDTDMLEANPGQLVVYRFNAPRYLPPTAVATGLMATPVSISFGFVQTNVTTGTYFPDEPYIEENSAWWSGSQSNAKSFLFTITPDAGKSLTITGISFRAYATFAGPSAISYDIAGGLATHTVNAPDSALVVVSQAVVGVSSVTNPILIQIQGWTNGSRVTSGSGIFKLDDVVLYGTVGELTAPEISVLSQDGILINDGDSTPSPIDGTDFGDVGVRGYESTRSFKITNSGPDVLILGQVFFSGAHTSDYTTAHAPTNLAPGSSTLLSITFNPTAAGLRTATVNIPNNDGDENPYNFNVQGTGAMAGFGSSPTSLVFTTTQGTNPDPQLLNLMNVGDDLLYYTITTNQPWLLTVPRTGTLSVANSANISVLVLAGSLSTGNYQGMLTFTDAGASNSPYNVPVQLEVQAPTPIIRYVWTNSPSPTAPYTNWQTAARTIQDAVNVAVNGDTVLVTNGLYSSGQQLVNGEPFRLVVTNHVHVKSVNGPVETVIDGNQSIRVVYISNPDSVVEGFTITGGYGYSGSSAGGGGVTILAGAVIKSIISSNRVYVSQSTAGATGYGFGGGIIMGGGSRLENCLVAYNRLDAIGGSWNPTLFIPAGSGWAEGGGIYAGPSGVVDIVNCTIVENVAYAGHGFHNFPNYQFVNVVRGGGVYANTNANVLLINTIIYSNKLTTGSNGGDSQGFNYFGGNYLYCLSSPLATGTGNTSDSPIFFNHAAGDFRLAAGSPGINEGTNQLWMTIATDLDGNPRIFNDAVDMGAYENLTLVNTLTILGNPEPHGVSSPYNYGVHVLASGITITNTVVSPADESPGQRFVASGWTGIGSLPTSGVGTVVSFTLTNDTTLTWKWTRQFALVQSSTLAGAISVTTNWWGEGDVANTVLAPLVATGSLYYFAEWRDAGQRLPDNTSPASNPAGILMNTARTAVAVYYLEGVDSNGDGLEDWFQRRHFGTNTPSANADVDLDGQTNKEEQEADTNPNNPGSVFKMHRITSSGVQTNFEIRINTQPYRKYTIEFSDVNLAAGGGWRTFSNLANGVGTWVDLSFSSNSFTFIDNFSTNTSGYPPTNGLRHYRIRVADAPFITFYRDSDGDGYGWSAMQISAPLAPTGYVAIAGDCNDNAPTTYPGALELCGNGADDDCDGQTDEVSLDDGVSCTIDSCVDGVVVHTPNDSLCDDGNPCTIETCDPLIGCVQTSALGCFAWSPALNCMEIKANNPAAPSGLYWIDPDGAGTNAPFEIYCDMTSE